MGCLLGDVKEGIIIQNQYTRGKGSSRISSKRIQNLYLLTTIQTVCGGRENFYVLSFDNIAGITIGTGRLWVSHKRKTIPKNAVQVNLLYPLRDHDYEYCSTKYFEEIWLKTVFFSRIKRQDCPGNI